MFSGGKDTVGIFWVLSCSTKNQSLSSFIGVEILEKYLKITCERPGIAQSEVS